MNSVSDAIDQLQQQVKTERATIVAEMQKEIAALSHELKQTRRELALVDVLANAESPSAMVH